MWGAVNPTTTEGHLQRHVEVPAGDGQQSLAHQADVNVSDPFEAVGSPQLALVQPGCPEIDPLGHFITGRPRSISVRSAVSFLLGMALLLGDPLLLRERVGFVGRRFFATASACLTSATSRSSAAWRFWAWLRRSLATTRTIPSESSRDASFGRSRSRSSSVTATERGQIPQQLDARRRGVDVLAAGAAGARCLVLKLRSRNRHARRHSQERRAIHSRLQAERQTSSGDDRPACNRARPGSSNTRYSRLQRFSGPDSFAVCNSSRDSCDSPPARPTPR